MKLTKNNTVTCRYLIGMFLNVNYPSSIVLFQCLATDKRSPCDQITKVCLTASNSSSHSSKSTGILCVGILGNSSDRVDLFDLSFNF